MKREFKPEMTVVRFGAEDVIATSGARTVGLSGFEDGNMGNNTFNVGGSTFVMADAQGTPDDNVFQSFRAALGSYYGDSGFNSCGAGQIYFGEKNINELYKQQVAGMDGNYSYNGTGTFKFTKQ